MGSSVNGIGVNLAWLLLLLSCDIIASEQSGTESGCRLIIKNLTVNEACCERAIIPVQACGGYCRSTNVPVLRLLGSQLNTNAIFTSKAHCCTIDEDQFVTGLDIYCNRTEEVCESTGFTNKFREAKSCKCDQCM